MADKEVKLDLESLGDDSGAKLTAELDKELQHVEDHIQDYMLANHNSVPSKAYVVTVTLEIEATGPSLRNTIWSVETKYPKTAKKHLQQARSKDGVMVTFQPQAVLDYDAVDEGALHGLTQPHDEHEADADAD